MKTTSCSENPELQARAESEMDTAWTNYARTAGHLDQGTRAHLRDYYTRNRKSSVVTFLNKVHSAGGSDRDVRITCSALTVDEASADPMQLKATLTGELEATTVTYEWRVKAVARKSRDGRKEGTSPHFSRLQARASSSSRQRSAKGSNGIETLWTAESEKAAFDILIDQLQEDLVTLKGIPDACMTSWASKLREMYGEISSKLDLPAFFQGKGCTSSGIGWIDLELALHEPSDWLRLSFVGRAEGGLLTEAVLSNPVTVQVTSG